MHQKQPPAKVALARPGWSAATAGAARATRIATVRRSACIHRSDARGRGSLQALDRARRPGARSHMPYRVIQWSTGNVGKLALRGIINHPDLELVGLWVHGADKVGRDAGDLCGLGRKVGVSATSDADALLALDADCVSYTATADIRLPEAVADLCRILEAGKNVVSTSVVPLVFPPGAPADIVERLEAACQKGGTSCFTSGIDPGFANDALPIMLLSACERVDSVRGMEILDYATYYQPTA